MENIIVPSKKGTGNCGKYSQQGEEVHEGQKVQEYDEQERQYYQYVQPTNSGRAYPVYLGQPNKVLASLRDGANAINAVKQTN